MVAWLRERKKLLLIICSIILLIAILWNLAVSFKLVDVGLDKLEKSRQNASVRHTRAGYMRLQTDRSVFSAADSIPVTISTAYYNTLEIAEMSEYVGFVLGFDDYFEIELLDVEAEILPWNDPDDVVSSYDNEIQLKITEYDCESIVYNRFGLFDHVTRRSLPYSVSFLITIKEDAPQQFAKTIGFYICGDQVKWYPEHGSSQYADPTGSIKLRIERDGDRIVIS